MTKEWFVEYGYPICFPSIEVLTIGAGGGSLAWIDEAGSLRNGPQSAGADPGPGLLRARQRAADEHRREPRARPARRRADRRRDDARPRRRRDARSARTSPSRSGSSSSEAASAIIQVANANMADAVRLISIRRGYDPREFALVVFGGAGPLHGAALAQELAIPTVLVPPNPGITSALGCLLVDVRHDLSTMYLGARRRGRPGRARGASSRKLEAEARERLEHEGVPERADVAPALDRHALPRPVALAVDPRRRAARASRRRSRASTPSTSASTTTAATARRSRSTASSVRAIGVTPKPELARHEATARRRGRTGDAAPSTSTSSTAPVETPVYDARASSRPAPCSTGPAVIDQLDSTTVVPPGWRPRSTSG